MSYIISIDIIYHRTNTFNHTPDANRCIFPYPTEIATGTNRMDYFPTECPLGVIVCFPNGRFQMLKTSILKRIKNGKKIMNIMNNIHSIPPLVTSLSPTVAHRCFIYVFILKTMGLKCSKELQKATYGNGGKGIALQQVDHRHMRSLHLAECMVKPRCDNLFHPNDKMLDWKL